MKRRLFTLLVGVAGLVWAGETFADQPQPQQTQGAQDEHHRPPRGQPGQAPSVYQQPGAPGPQGPRFERAPQAHSPGAQVATPPPFVHQLPGGVAGGQGPRPQTYSPGAQVVTPPPAVRPQFQPRQGEFQNRRPGPPQEHPGFRPAPTPPQAAIPPRGEARAHRAPNLPQLGGWDRSLRGADHDVAGREWRQNHSGWDRNTPWRHDRNWWRNSSAFSLFLGPRAGFFFIPELGYIAAPAAYQHRMWRPGERLPRWFWTYEVRDYWTYGLPPPPIGCAWVWVGRDVALVDLDDGYILDIVRNIW